MYVSPWIIDSTSKPCMHYVWVIVAELFAAGLN